MGTFSSLYYHLVWSTHERETLIKENLEKELYPYICAVIQKHKASVLEINGMPDHVHILVKARPDCFIPDVVKDVKISTTKMLREKYSVRGFSWQSGYGIFSVSLSQVEKVRAYIINQKQNHKDKTFESEFMKFLDTHDLKYNKDYLF